MSVRIRKLFIFGFLLSGLVGCHVQTKEQIEPGSITKEDEKKLDRHQLTEEQEVDETFKSRLKQLETEKLEKGTLDFGGIWGVSGQGSCKFASAISAKGPGGLVVLTFDDGPDKILTSGALDVLNKYHIKATFFVTGKQASKNQDVLARMKAEGHLIANHSYGHPNFHVITEEEAQKQIVATEKYINAFMSESKYFRYPYGNSTCATNDFLRDRGYGIVGWHVDTCDWAFNQTGTVSGSHAEICGVQQRNKSDFVNHVVETVRKHNGGIVLMHDIRPRTIGQLEDVIQGLFQNGYRFANLDDIRMAHLVK